MGKTVPKPFLHIVTACIKPYCNNSAKDADHQKYYKSNKQRKDQLFHADTPSLFTLGTKTMVLQQEQATTKQRCDPAADLIYVRHAKKKTREYGERGGKQHPVKCNVL